MHQRSRLRACCSHGPRLRQCVPIGLLPVAVALVGGFVGTSASASTPVHSPAARPGGSGSIGVRLIDEPGTSASDPRAQIYIIDHVAPGAVLHRRVEVTNTTAGTAHISLYAAAAGIEHGSFLGGAGHTANDVSSWTSVLPATAAVAAGDLAMATVTIAVPRDAAAGERYAAVWAEVRSAPSSRGGVVQVDRVGIRIYLYVGPGGPPAAGFSIDSVSAGRSPGGGRLILARVRNTGGRALDMSGTLLLSAGPGGLRAGPFQVPLGTTTVAIGDSEPVTIAVAKAIPAGPWNADLTLRSGMLEHQMRATVTFATGGAATRSHPTKHLEWRYLAVGALAFLLLDLAAVLLLVSRRRHGSAGVAGPHDAVELLASGKDRP